MRILLISDVSSHMRGGVPAETRSLIRGLTQRGHVVALASDAPLGGAEEALHVPMRLPVGDKVADDIGPALESFDPEFVHVICMSSKGVVSLAPLLASRSWALTVHSVPPYERKLPRLHTSDALHYTVRALRFLANSLAWRWVLRGAMVPRVIVHSQFVEEIVARYGGQKARCSLIPLPFDCDEDASSVASSLRNESAPLLVTVAGIAHTKGQRDVLKALPELIAAFPGLRYQIVGEIRDESYLQSLRDLASSLGITKSVLITPNLSGEDKRAALVSADVYVQPSHEEGFCLAFAEAAALVPRLVGTDTGAIAAMSRDDAGARVVPTRQPRAIAAAVADLLRVGLSAGHMAERAQRLSARFSLAGYVRSHEELYAANSGR